MIKSVSYDQTEILNWILELNELQKFDADLTYGNGAFYKDIPEPDFKFDIDPQQDGVIQASSTEVPAVDGAFQSVVFDPPFLTYVKAARDHNSIMAKRFGGYWRYEELEDHYKATLKEAYRILVKRGILVFKCQDIIHNHKMHPTHINVSLWASNEGFRLKDFFVLPAKHRMPMPDQDGAAKRKQKHARIFQSYFMVLERT
jgi:hypothetical protein